LKVHTTHIILNDYQESRPKPLSLSEKDESV